MAQQISASTTASFGQMNKEAQNFATRTANQMKDVSRIVQGILISQGFYQTARGFRELTAGIVDMQMVLEDADTAFTHFLGNADAAGAYLDKVQDFAAVTPFRLEESISAANRLLALGFETGKIIPIMRRVTDATAALGGSPETYESIITTLGKIQTTGRITARDVNSLARQGVNASKYLREAFSLTNEELRKIGDLDIPAEAAINALLNGMGEFSGLSQSLSRNLRGLISTFTDDIQILGILISQDLFDRVSAGFETVTDHLGKLVEVTRELGTGGLFERIVPPELQNQVRLIGMSLQEILRAIATFGKAFKEVFGSVAAQLVQIGALLLPPFARLASVLANLTYQVLLVVTPLRDLLAAIVALFIIQKIGFIFLTFIAILKKMQIVLFVSEWITILSGALKGLYMVFMGNPWVAGITAIVAVLLYFASKLEVVQRAVGTLTSQIGALFGFKVETFWQPDKGSANSWDDYMDNINGGLQEIEEGYDDAADAAGKAKKANEGFLASFDEIFQVPDKKDSGGSGKDDDAGGGDFPIIDFTGDPEPSRTETDFALTKTKSLWDDINDFLKNLPPFVLPPFIWPTPLPQLVSDLSLAFDAILSKLNAFALDFGKAFAALPAELQKIWQLIIEYLLGLEGQLIRLMSLADMMSKIFVNLFNPLAVGADLAREALKGLGDGWNNFVEVLNGWKSTALEAGIAIGTGLVTGLQTGWQAIGETFGGIVDSFIKFFQDCYNTAVEFDAQVNSIIVGAVNGILVTVGAFFSDALQFILDGLGKIKGLWEEHQTAILVIVGAIATAVLLVFTGMTAGVGTAVAGMASIVIALFVGVKDSFADSGEQIKNNTIGVFEQMRQGVAETWRGLLQDAIDTWNKIGKTIKDTINGIIGNINHLIDGWNRLKFDIPTIKLPGGGSLGGGTIRVPNIGRIPQLATGGIVKDDIIARVGEGSSPEAVLPLNEASLRPLATMLGNMIGQRPYNPNTGTPGDSYGSGNPVQIVFMATDDRSLRELARKLEVTQIGINRGRG